MKTITIILFAVLAIQSPLIHASDDLSMKDDVRKNLWNEFQLLRHKNIDQYGHVRLYAENSSLNRICFISDKGLFLFIFKDQNADGKSRIERIQHAKLVMYDTINRLSYDKDEDVEIGFFNLWNSGNVELSVGSN